MKKEGEKEHGEKNADQLIPFFLPFWASTGSREMGKGGGGDNKQYSPFEQKERQEVQDVHFLHQV